MPLQFLSRCDTLFITPKQQKELSSRETRTAHELSAPEPSRSPFFFLTVFLTIFLRPHCLLIFDSPIFQLDVPLSWKAAKKKKIHRGTVSVSQPHVLISEPFPSPPFNNRFIGMHNATSRFFSRPVPHSKWMNGVVFNQG